MSGPWEKYASAPTDAPWLKYATPAPAEAPPDPTGNVLQNFSDATGGALVRAGNAYQQAANAVGQGVRSILPAGINAALDRANTSLGLSTADQARDVTNASIAEHARLDKPLNATGGGMAGNVLGTALTLAPAAASGAGLVPMIGSNALMAGLLTPGDASERGFAAFGGGAGAAGGRAIGEGLGNALSARLAAKTVAGETAAAQNATRDATFAAGRDAGYVVPPATINQGLVPSLLEGVSGKIKTGQSAAVKNQDVTNRLSRQALGLAEDAPLDKAALGSLRATAGDAYDAVSKTGPVKADAAYTAAIQGLGKGALAKEFPELANGEIGNLVTALDKPGFSAESAVELTKKLRFDGSANKALQDPAKQALGRAQLDAAKAVEGVLDRNLQASGQGDLLKQFQDARTQIAKTYTVEKALNEGSGNVIANKLAAQLQRGKPLSGELRQIAEFSQAFPKATQEINTSTPMFTPLDMFAGGVGAGMGNPLAIALTAGRPLARAAALSPLVQRSLSPQYGPGLIGRQVPKIADNDLMRAILQYGSAAGTANALK